MKSNHIKVRKPGLIECPECNGRGEVHHPLYGQRSCPCPEVTCPECGGLGTVEGCVDCQHVECECGERD